jgi:hypothetical protein
MIFQLMTREELRPRYYLNGFPKAGLHLLALMVAPACKPMATAYHNTEWLGTFMGNSWSTVWKDEDFLFLLSLLQHGRYYKGHCGHKPEIAQFMNACGIAHVFVYRDLRDVAVSQTYHVLNPDDEKQKHPAKAVYQLLHKQGGIDAVLSAVIEGVGPLPGVIERWKLYAPWLDEDWTLSISFEELLTDRQAAADRVLAYGLERVIERLPFNATVEGSMYDELQDKMAEWSQHTHLSPTYREGKSGGWREHFTDEHKALWKRCDSDGWLAKLGYEENDEW